MPQPFSHFRLLAVVLLLVLTGMMAGTARAAAASNGAPCPMGDMAPQATMGAHASSGQHHKMAIHDCPCCCMSASLETADFGAIGVIKRFDGGRVSYWMAPVVLNGVSLAPDPSPPIHTL